MKTRLILTRMMIFGTAALSMGFAATTCANGLGSMLLTAAAATGGQELFYYIDFREEDLGGWTTSPNIQQDMMVFDDRRELWAAILPGMQPPAYIISPQMQFPAGKYSIAVEGRCIEADKEVVVKIYVGDRLVGESTFGFEEASVAQHKFSMDTATEGHIGIKIVGGSGPWIALREVTIIYAGERNE